MTKLKLIISIFAITLLLSFIVVYINIQYTLNKSNNLETVTTIPVNLISRVSEV